MYIDVSIALDALSIVYMLILAVSLGRRHRRELLDQQYRRIVLAVCLFLALDIVYLCLYGSAGLGGQMLLKIVKNLYFLVNAAIVWLWACYLDHLLSGERRGPAQGAAEFPGPAWKKRLFSCFTGGPQGRKSSRTAVFCTAVFAVNSILVAVNSFIGLLFQITPQGTFQVRPGPMWLFTALNYLSIFAAMAALIRHRDKVRRDHFLPLLLFPLPPLCAELVQIAFQPCSLICAYAVSVLLVFQVAQNYAIQTDGLTGLANRRMLDETLENWFSQPKGALVCGAMLDLDGLKYVNDTYGHLSGDNMLLATAEVLKKIRRKELVPARYGGDEFVLVWQAETESDLEQAARELAAAKARVNALKPAHERAEFSVGLFCCRDDAGYTAEGFLKEADSRMYQEKQKKKQGAQGRGAESPAMK